MIFTISLLKESNVFDLTGAVEASVWSIKKTKEEDVLIETQFNSQLIPSMFKVVNYIQPSYQNI